MYVCCYTADHGGAVTYSVLYITYVVTARFSGVTLKAITSHVSWWGYIHTPICLDFPNNIIQHLLLLFLSTILAHLRLCSSLIISPLMAILLWGCVTSLLITPNAFLPVLPQCCLCEIVSSMSSFFICWYLFSDQECIKWKWEVTIQSVSGFRWDTSNYSLMQVGNNNNLTKNNKELSCNVVYLTFMSSVLVCSNPYHSSPHH